ncbi:hypothetical protein ACFV4F_20940 [Kitasatospora sp. NPDC059722]|uniref:hypothetical protein n=1 Tax=Kitasatospora sp. NPDC059722 TaxID=3346925 RepID=UPI0036A72808
MAVPAGSPAVTAVRTGLVRQAMIGREAVIGYRGKGVVRVALAGKGSRVIVVGGDRYRWTVAPDDEPGLAVVVAHAQGDGQRLVVWVEHGVVIAPGLVAGLIREALVRHGWTPRSRRRQLTLRSPDANPDPARPALVPWPPAQ